MKKYVAFSNGDIAFLANAGLPLPLTSKQICHFKRIRNCYVPESYSPLDKEQALWMRQYLDEQNGQLGRQNKPLTARTLLSTLRESHIFLPLDSNAFLFAVKQGLKYELPADLLNTADFYATKQNMRKNFHAWSGKHDARDFGWSENWFEHDRLSFIYTTWTAHMATKLIPVLAATADDLICIGRQTPSILPSFSSNEIAQAIWQKALPDLVTPITYTATRGVHPHLESAGDQNYSVMQHSVTLAFFEINFPRHKKLIENTVAQSKRPVTLALMHCLGNSRLSQATLNGYLPIENCQTVVIPSFSGTLSHFPSNIIKLFQESMQNYLPYADVLDFIFTDLATTRFYNLEKIYNNLCSLWQQYRPQLCIAENVAFGEYCIPFLAAKALQIPSISIPHGVPYFSEGFTAVPATAHTHCLPLEVEAWRDFVAPDTENVCLQEFDMYSSYAKDPSIRYSFPKDTHIILVILGATLYNTPLLHSAYPQNVRGWLKTLACIPKHMSSKALVIYKLHPGFSDHAIVANVGIEQKYVLPSESSLSDILPHVNMLISCEYVSSPSLLGMKKNIPVLHCLDESTIRNADYNMQKKLVVARAGQLCSNADILWKYIDELIDNTPARTECLAKQNSFLEEYVYPKASGWGEYMEKIISEYGT